MTIQDLRSQGAIYLTNIQEGFDQYHFETICLTEKEAFDYFHNIWESSQYAHAYVDFYYYTLDAPSREKVLAVLSDEECVYLQENSPALTTNTDELIFLLTETLLHIICKLNATATLFSTLYFTDAPRTYWGNYNQEYVLFT